MRLEDREIVDVNFAPILLKLVQQVRGEATDNMSVL